MADPPRVVRTVKRNDHGRVYMLEWTPRGRDAYLDGYLQTLRDHGAPLPADLDERNDDA